MSKQKLVSTGGIDVYVPDDKMFDIATLKTDLRPVIKALERIRDGKPHPGRPKKAENHDV